jgi:hypothetical protein
MIISNGTIEVKTKSGGGIDPETGFPVPPTTSWELPIDCQYYANKVNQLGRVNGEHFTVASYVILIEEQPFDAEQIRLKNRKGKILGEFSIMEIEPLEAVCQIRIIV